VDARYIDWAEALREPVNARVVSIVASAGCAVREARRQHKLADNSVAVWELDRVRLVPPERITG